MSQNSELSLESISIRNKDDDRFVEKLKANGCPDLNTTRDPKGTDMIVIYNKADVYSLLLAAEAAKSDSVATLRKAIVDRPSYSFSGTLSDRQDCIPPASLLFALSRMMYGNDDQPYSPDVVHIACMVC